MEDLPSDRRRPPEMMPAATQTRTIKRQPMKRMQVRHCPNGNHTMVVTTAAEMMLMKEVVASKAAGKGHDRGAGAPAGRSTRPNLLCLHPFRWNEGFALTDVNRGKSLDPNRLAVV